MTPRDCPFCHRPTSCGPTRAMHPSQPRDVIAYAVAHHCPIVGRIAVERATMAEAVAAWNGEADS